MINQKKVALIKITNPIPLTIIQVQIVGGKKKFVVITLTDLKQQLFNLP